ncbi:RNase P subunit p30-domain-containing protein [Lipomyces japonicus]|uniref:RNase P subunit p30-domain-containing protein n=1 Tax=Lipomyces japonicus TaxID=56871 RepID=UPI0034CEF944
MFFDLCVEWPQGVSSSDAPLLIGKATGPVPDLYKTVALLDNMGYGTIVYNYNHTGKITPSFSSPIIKDIFSPSLPKTQFLSRITFTLDDTSKAQFLPGLTAKFDIVAVRPTTEKLLLAACTSLELDLISLDLSQRLPFHLRHRTVGAAVARGLKFEICYSSSTRSSSDLNSRRNLIANAAALFRATRGKGIVISSGALSALECRAPYDISNLATLWGFSMEKGKEAVQDGAKSVVVRARARRRSWKGVVEVDLHEQDPQENVPNAKRRKVG